MYMLFICMEVRDFRITPRFKTHSLCCVNARLAVKLTLPYHTLPWRVTFRKTGRPPIHGHYHCCPRPHVENGMLVDFINIVCTCMPGGQRSWLRSVLLCPFLYIWRHSSVVNVVFKVCIWPRDCRINPGWEVDLFLFGRARMVNWLISRHKASVAASSRGLW